MKKIQIIAPLVAMGIVAVFLVFTLMRNQARSFLAARAHSVGYELIKSTNATGLVTMSDGLRRKMAEFLASPAHEEAVRFGDEPSPVGDGRATVRLFLRNEKAERLALRLRPDTDTDKLHVLGYWTP